MADMTDDWFETVRIKDQAVHLSKFLRSDFIVSAEKVVTNWSSWTSTQKLRFASAFSARPKLNDEDQRLLDFLIENGNVDVWSAIALTAAKHQNRQRAIEFLLTRVTMQEGVLANYYQAIAELATVECVPVLTEALSKHRQDMDLHPSIANWSDRFAYLDYLACSAALFRITGEQGYRANITTVLSHPDELVRQMARAVGHSAGVVA